MSFGLKEFSCMLQEEKEIYRRLILKDVIIFYIKESMYVQDLFHRYTKSLSILQFLFINARVSCSYAFKHAPKQPPNLTQQP
jgi:hypothetical protein